MLFRRLAVAAAVAPGLLALGARSAFAWAGCKDAVASQGQDWATAYSYSTLGMMATPYVLLGVFFLVFRRANRKPPAPPPGDAG